MPTVHWDYVVILLVLGVPIPLLGRRRMRQLFQKGATSKLERLLLYASTIVFQCALVAGILWRTSGHHVRNAELALAISRPALTVELAVVLSGLFLANQLFALRRLELDPEQQPGVLLHLAAKVFPQDLPERFAFSVLVLTVSTCEEIIYRGFVQFLFQQITGLIVLGILFSSLFFAWAHFYQGRRGLVSTFIVGLLFASIRSWTGSLVPSAAAHFVTDLAVGIMAPIRVRRAIGFVPEGRVHA